MRAQAIVFPAANQVEIQELEMPTLQDDEALIATRASGVSQGTEMWTLSGQRPEIRFPTVPGYQSVGIIEALGKAAQQSGKYHIGQRVVFRSSRLPEGFAPTWMGAHISHALVPCLEQFNEHGDRAPVAVPDEVSDEEACLAALPAVSLRGLEMLRIKEGDVAVVIGQGLIGQGSAQLARIAGARVIACDIDATRLELSRQSGTQITVNAQSENLGAIVKHHAPNGADIVIETTGRASAFAQCIDLLRWEGQLLLQGWYSEPISFDFHRTHGKKPTIAITCGYDEIQVAKVLQLMQSRQLKFEPLITHRASFTQAPALYRQMQDKNSSLLGVVFSWNN